MKKTIALAALLASSSAMAMPMPRDPNEPQPVVSKVCLSTFKSAADKSIYATCDETRNNARLKRQLLANGCAKGQVALSFLGESTINSCMPPGMVQL